MQSVLYINKFLGALFFSVVVETIVLFAICKLVNQFRKIKFSNILLAGVFSTFATIPYLWFVLPEYIENRYVFLAVGEVAVTLVESVIIWQILSVNWTKAFAISIVCNLCSFILAMLK